MCYPTILRKAFDRFFVIHGLAGLISEEQGVRFKIRMTSITWDLAILRCNSEKMLSKKAVIQ